MTTLQWTTIGGALILFLVIYFGCETQPKDIAALEKSRALSVESTDVQTLLLEAKAQLDPSSLSEITALEEELSNTLSDTAKLEVQKALAGQWYALGQVALSGYYAQEVASVEMTDDAWSIAGTTYTICIQRAEKQKVKDFCMGRAVNAFESAISLDPTELAHQVNLALAYTYSPPADNPMKGVLLLRELNNKAPDNVLVLNTLARLAIQTGQFDKALARLENALALASENTTTICLLAQAYKGAGNSSKAADFAARCRAASNDLN